MAGGRPSKYDPEYCQKMIDFFDIDHTVIKTKDVVNQKTGEVNTVEIEEGAKLPTFERFAADLGTHRETLRNWCNEHEEFFAAYKKCQELQKDMLIDLAIRGYYNPTFSIFTAKNITDMRDKVETENVNINIPVELTPEQRAARIAELKNKMESI